MTFFKRFNSIRLLKASLLTLAAFSFALPSVSYAQQNVGNSSPAQTVLEDGTYLFGQSPERDVIGSAYAVFSVENGHTVGAFYQPHSSYDCFSGEVLPNRLAVNIVDSYSQAIYPYSVALTVTDTLVAGTGVGSHTLEGFHRIDSLSPKDAEILAVCEADFSE